jgi:hypothetical protein
MVGRKDLYPEGIIGLSLGFQPRVIPDHGPALTRRFRPRPRFRPRGEMEYWSVGVLRQVRIAPLGRGVGGAERAADSSFQDLVRSAPVRNSDSTAPLGRIVFESDTWG